MPVRAGLPDKGKPKPRQRAAYFITGKIAR